MEALEIIDLIRKSEKKTPVRVTVQEKLPCEFEGVEVFSGGCGLKILFFCLSYCVRLSMSTHFRRCRRSVPT